MQTGLRIRGPEARRRVASGFVALVGLLLGSFGPQPAAAATTGSAQQLADRYAPVVMVRALTDVCDTEQEQFSPPTSVDAVLDNPAVRLLTRGRRHPRLVTYAPTVADVAGKDAAYWLDLPGDALVPGCRYARDFRALRRSGRVPAVTYAHIAQETGVPGFALQYWFFYYYNQFNDLHEGDWEGMQLWFEAATPRDALSREPSEILLFQHAGGEHAGWDDPRVQTEGTHPVVYAAAGSHATYYSSALYLGNGRGGSGVGCDNTTGPVTAVRPRAVLLPDQVPTRGRFAWLSYTGRWGQREAGFNNGPAGPSTKTQWTSPYTWMQGTRNASPIVPAGSIAGPSVTKLFCGAVQDVTSYINLAAKTTPGAAGLGLAVLAAVLIPVLLTTWRPALLRPLARRRALGQVLATSAKLWARERRIVLALALSVLGMILAGALVVYLVRLPFGMHTGGLSLDASQESSGLLTSGGVAQPLIDPIAAALSVAVMGDLYVGRPASYAATWRTVLPRLWRVVLVRIAITVACGATAITIVGIPFALRKLVDWQFATQEVILEDRSVREALRGSTRVVRGHWWWAGSCDLVLFLISQIPGPVIGFALLFAPVRAGVVNLIGAVIWCLLLPFADFGRTLIYLDLRERPAQPTAAATARWRRWGRSRSGREGSPAPTGS